MWHLIRTSITIRQCRIRRVGGLAGVAFPSYRIQMAYRLKGARPKKACFPSKVVAFSCIVSIVLRKQKYADRWLDAFYPLVTSMSLAYK